MIASLIRATPLVPLERGGTDSLFKRLDSDGNGRLTVADRAPTVLSLSPQARARYAQAANRFDLPSQAQQRDVASARYQAVQSLAA